MRSFAVCTVFAGAVIAAPVAQYAGPQYGGPPNLGPQYGGPPNRGPQYDGPQYDGPQYGGPPNLGPQYGGPPNRGPQYDGPPNFGPPSPGPQYGGPRYGGDRSNDEGSGGLLGPITDALRDSGIPGPIGGLLGVLGQALEGVLGIGTDLIGGILGISRLTAEQTAQVEEIKAAVKQVKEKHGKQ